MSQYKKSQPVVVLGAVIAALSFMIDSLQALFKDSPTVVLILSVVGVVVAALAIFKDQFLKSQVVPVEDTATYIDQTGQLVAGPASPLPDGTPIDDTPKSKTVTPYARPESLDPGTSGEGIGQDVNL